LPWSLIGTAAWSASLTLAGYLFHASFEAATGVLTRGALAVAVLAALVIAARELRRARARRSLDRV
jgi:membrane protein DedA with SNARE-associated domain